MEFQQNAMPYLREIKLAPQLREETAELIVPDSFPDAERIVWTSAVPVVRSKQLENGSVAVSGGVRAEVLFCAQEDNAPFRMECYVPFSVKTEADLPEGASLQVHVWARDCDARIVNSRKLSVRVNLGCGITAFCPEELITYSPPEDTGAVQLLRTRYPMTLPVETAEKQFHLSEELSLPEGESVLSVRVTPEISEQRVAGDKAAFKGLAHVRVLYPDSAGKPECYETSIPFSQFCELGAVYDDAELAVTPILTGIETERVPRGEGSALLLDLHLLAQCVVSEEKTLDLCEDGYALGGVFEPEWSEYALTARLDRSQETLDGSESFRGDVRSIAAAEAIADLPQTQRAEGGAEIAVPCAAKLLYYDGNGELQGATVRAQIKRQLPLAENAACRAEVQSCDCSAAVSADGAEVSFTARVCTACDAPAAYRAIKGCRVEAEAPQGRKRCAVVARRLRGEETLWQLAKANGTTVERICSANGLESENVPPQSILLIPTSL